MTETFTYEELTAVERWLTDQIQTKTDEIDECNNMDTRFHLIDRRDDLRTYLTTAQKQRDELQEVKHG